MSGIETRERQVSFDATLREEGSFCDAAVGPKRVWRCLPPTSRCSGLRGDLVVRPPIAATAYSCIAAKRKKIAWAVCLLETRGRCLQGVKRMLDEPPSPCTGVCRIDADAGWCSGCRRTLDEIAAWGNAPAAFKQAVLAQLDERACAPSPVVE